MRKIIMIAASTMLALSAMAQETYENAKFIGDDLNGTARYVGMGGAMEALGADISTISSNPAGLGLFRSNMVSTSFGLVSQQDATSFRNANKTNMSFDQLGFVYSIKMGDRNFKNIAINYHKSKNLDFILSAADRLNGASQNKLSYVKGSEGVFNIKPNSDGTYIGYDSQGNYSAAFNQLDYLYYNTLLAPDANNTIYYSDATSYDFNRGNRGYVGEWEMSVSGNEQDWFYWGITFGLKNIYYKGESLYQEVLPISDGSDNGAISVNDYRKITGTGFDIKYGMIFRPIRTSPFRIGVYVHSPTWYDMKTKNETTLGVSTNLLTIGDDNTRLNQGKIAETYEFKFRTPWKFGVSLGHTVGSVLALGATYEYSDYGWSDIRVNDGGYYDSYWGSYYETSTRDEAMKEHLERTLKGVSTLKVGAEMKVVPNVAVRVGYNYVSPAYSKDGFKDGSLNSYGSYYASATDYTNWKSTNRFTAGVGLTCQKWNFDLAYQYSQTNGEFSPFMSYYPYDSANSALTNDAGMVEVSNKRNQLLFTVGYRF